MPVPGPSFRPSPVKRGASRDLERFGIIVYFWIPDLAMHRIARPE